MVIKYGVLFYLYLLSRLGKKPKKKIKRKATWI